MAISLANGNPNRPQIIDPTTLKPFDLAEPDAPPHVVKFSALWNLASKTYRWTWDEAYGDNREDALSMRRDCYLMGLLRERQYPVAQMPWHIEPEDAKDPFQSATCDQMDKWIKAIPDLDSLLMCLTEATWYGRYGVQVKLDKETVAGEEVNMPVDWEPVNGDKLQFQWDGTPTVMIYAPAAKNFPDSEILRGDRSTLLRLGDPFFRQRFIINKADIVDADYYHADEAGGRHGVGIRHWIRWIDWIKREILSWAMDFLERTGLGTTIFFYDEGNPKSKEAAEKAAEQQSRNTVIIFPRSAQGANTGSGVERMETATAGAAFVLEMMKYFDEKQERFVVGQTLSANTEGHGLGGTGVAAMHADTKSRIIRHDCGKMANALTQDLCKVLLRLNRPEMKFRPRWEFDIDRPDPKQKMEAAKTVFDMGAPVKVADVYSFSGLSKPTADDEVLQQQQQQPANPFNVPPGQPGGGGEHDTAPPGQNNGNMPFASGGPPPRQPLANGSEGPQRFAADGDVRRYRAESGQWITIGGRTGDDGKKHGGSPVYVENGRITKGHPGLHGRKIDSLKEEPDSGTHRQQLASSKGYERAVWGKKARKEGIDPKGLHQLAAEVMAHDKEFKADHKKMLGRARELSEKLGYGSLQGLAARNARGRLDADSIRGLDDVAERMANAYPAYFAGEKDPQERLFNLLVDSNPEVMTEDEAYTQAFDHLMEQKQTAGEREEEAVPFARQGEVNKYAQLHFPWNEFDHPRDKGGEFTSKGEGESGPSSKEETPPQEPPASAKEAGVFKDKNGVVWARAKAGGETSPVNGVHYKGGRWMPIHGLSIKPEKPAKAKPPQGGEMPKPPSEEGGRQRTPRAPMSAEEIEAEKQKKVEQDQWHELNRGPLGRIKWLGNSPNYKAMQDSRTNLKEWKDMAEKIGEDKLKDIAEKLEKIYHDRIDKEIEEEKAKGMSDISDENIQWEKNQPKRVAGDDAELFPGSKKHLKQVPSSFYVRQLLQHVMEKGGIPSLMQVNSMLSEALNETEPDKHSRHDDWLSRYNAESKHYAAADLAKLRADVDLLADMLDKPMTQKLAGGKGDRRSLSEFPIDQVIQGMEVEREHTPDVQTRMEIVADHLAENSDYYTKLKVVEKPVERYDINEHPVTEQPPDIAHPDVEAAVISFLTKVGKMTETEARKAIEEVKAEAKK